MILKLLLVYLVTFFSMISYADEKSIYEFEWMDQDKQIYVLQNRLFEKNQSLMLSLLGSRTMSNKFVDTYYGVLKVGYYFNEDWGLEVVGGFGDGSENTTANNVRIQAAVPFYRQIDHYFGALINWAPLYGKFNAFDKIFYLDWYFGLGLTSVSTSDNRNEFEVATDRSMTKDSHMGAIWQTGFLFNLSESWMIRFEFQGIHFQADLISEDTGNNRQNKKTFFHHYDLNLGVAVKF
jgi:outer membrane beta-barrel protein